MDNPWPTRRERGHLAKKSSADVRRRSRAEAEARFALAPPDDSSHSPGAKFLHELRVHQIELELQNEELRRAQFELEVSRDRFVDLYDFAPVGYLTLSRTGVIREANLVAATLLGLERRRLKGRRFSGFVCSGYADRWHLFFADLIAQRSARDFRGLVLRRAGGPDFDAHLVCHRQAEEGAAPEIRIALTDVTDARRTEHAIRELGEQLSFVIDSTNDGFTDWNVGSGAVTYSERFASMLGYGPGELRPDISTWEGLVHPEDRQRSPDAAHLRAFGDRAHYEFEARLRHMDGRWLWFRVRGKVVERDDHGNPVRRVSTFTDVTAIRVAADALRASMAEKDVLVAELRQALVEVKTLSGLLPFCMYCKKIRDGQGYWEEVERYISAHTDARFSHGVCDRCYAEAERRMG